MNPKQISTALTEGPFCAEVRAVGFTNDGRRYSFIRQRVLRSLAVNVGCTVTLCALLLALAPLASAQAPEPPDVPLPSALAKATHIFIGNAGDQENDDCLRAYKTFYTGVSALTRLQLVADPNQADLVLELHYEINLGQAVASGDSNKSVRQFRVVFLDPHSRIVLWSVTERTNYAAFKSNRNKNLDETVARLIGDVGSLLAEHPVPPNNDSRVKHGLAGLH